MAGTIRPKLLGPSTRTPAARPAACKFGIGVCIPPKRNRLVQHWYDKGLYRTRHLVETSFNRLKDFRRLSLRLDKTDTSFRGFLAFAAAILNWRLKVRFCAQAQSCQ